MIRKATLNDIPFILPLGEEFHKESRYANTLYDTGKVTSLLSWIITSDEGIGLVNEENGVITGGIGAYVYFKSWGWSKGSEDIVFFLSKNERGSLTALKLIKEYVKQAKEKGVDDIRLAVSSGINNDRIDRLYKRIGFEPVGTIYSYTGD